MTHDPLHDALVAIFEAIAEREDKTIEEVVAPLRDLTKRQAIIYQLMCQSASGLEPIELGQLMHAQSGRHSADEFCDFCGQDAARALREKAIRQRVVRRATGIYEPRTAQDWTGRADTGPGSGQLTKLPGETFEDLFGSAA